MVPVQFADTALPDINTAMHVSPTVPVAHSDNIVVQGLPDSITPRQPPFSTVHRLDKTAHALTSRDVDSCRGADISESQTQSPYYGADVTTSQPLYNADTVSALRRPCLFSETDTLTAQYFQPSAAPDTLSRRPVAAVVDSERAFSRELPQPPVDPGYSHRSDTLPRQLVAPVAVTDSAHMPSPRVVADRPYMDTPPHLQLRPIPRLLECTVTSALPDQPPCVPSGASAFPLHTDDLVTSMLPFQLPAVPTRPPPGNEVMTSMTEI